MNQRIDRSDLDQALQTLKSGGLILYPTDTIWGIGCDATNEAAVEKVFALKGRDKEKSMILLVHNDNQLASYVREVPEVAYQLIELADRPLTIIYQQGKNIPNSVLATDGSVGIRVVDHAFCTALLQRFRKPIVSTSANLSGTPSPRSYYDVDDVIRNGVDYVVQYGQTEIGDGRSSTVMRLDASGKFEFLRK